MKRTAALNRDAIFRAKFHIDSRKIAVKKRMETAGQ
jgi:hypothetical protein